MQDDNSMFDIIQQWEQDRLGKFTASEIHLLLGNGRRPMTPEELKEEEKKPASKRRKTVDTPLGEKAYSYIESRAAEILTQTRATNLDGLEPIEYGNSLEFAGFQAFINWGKYTVVDFSEMCVYFGKATPKFFPYERHLDLAGCSPDGLSEEFGVEVKAPFNPVHHVKHLQLKTQAELKQEKPAYYWQCVFNMMCTGRKTWYFVSYDGRVTIPKLQLHVIKIDLLEEDRNELDTRLDAAVEELKKLYSAITEA